MLIAVNIIAIGSHWDDIELGCSLTLKKLSVKDHNIFSVVVCSSQYGKDGDEAIIAAGGVVIKDIPPRIIVAGNPSKKLEM